MNSDPKPNTETETNEEEHGYLTFVRSLIQNGSSRYTRNGMCNTLFGASFAFDLSENKFPLLTTKKVSFKNIFYELQWFLSGSTDVKWLQDKGVKIWNKNAEVHGNTNLGPIYGKQFRNCGGVDQVKYCLDLIKTDPTSRRIVMSLWSPGDLEYQALPCCHGTAIQFFVTNEYLSLQMYQRSADVCLGLPYNIASYSLFLILMAHCTGKVPGRLRIVVGDGHIYEEHVPEAKVQAERIPFPFPTLKIKAGIQYSDPSEFKFSDLVLADYVHHPLVKFDMKA